MSEQADHPEVADADLGIESKRWPLWKILAVVVLVSAVPCVIVTGILASIFIPAVAQNLEQARQSKAKADILSIERALELYAIENDGRYPESLGMVEIPSAMDPWGNLYVYQPPAPGASDFKILTYGGDGRPGGEGASRDIDNVMIRNGEF